MSWELWPKLWPTVGPWLVVGLFLTVLVLLVCTLVLLWRTARLGKDYRRWLAGAPAGDLLKQLEEYRLLTEDALARVRRADERVDSLEAWRQQAVQHVGVVRFNAFADVGSDLSYAVALLDGRGDGVVLTGIYGRDESRSFAKPVQGGTSTYRLSREEEEAIRVAMQRPAWKDGRGPKGGP